MSVKNRSKKSKSKARKAKVKVLNVTKLAPKTDIVMLAIHNAPVPAPELSSWDEFKAWLKSIW